MDFIARPNRKFLSNKGNGYIKVKGEDGKYVNVVLDKQANLDWDKIEKLQVDNVHYEHSMLPTDEAGKPTGPAFSRLEVVDYITYQRTDLVEEMLLRRESRKAKVVKTIELENAAASEELA